MSEMTNLNYIDLAQNDIIDISPLVENPGIGDGDYLNLRSNRLSYESENVYIPELEERGVFIDH